MKKIIISLLFLVNIAYSKENRIKIAIIDSGIDVETSKQPYICEDGNVVFSQESPELYNTDHGSNIASAIGENIDSTEFCIVSYQVFGGGGDTYTTFLERLTKAREDLIKRNVKFVNMSIQGEGDSYLEYKNIKEIIQSGAIVSVSAGNHKKNLDDKCDEFPACYKKKIESRNMHIVGSYDKTYSNYGAIVQFKESGVWKGKRGTSQACAQHTARIVNIFMKYYDIVK